MGDTFHDAGRDLLGLGHVGDVRGHGLMMIDLMAETETKEPFPVASKAGG